MQIVHVRFGDRDSESSMNAVNQTLQNLAFVLEASGFGNVKLEYRYSDDYCHLLVLPSSGPAGGPAAWPNRLDASKIALLQHSRDGLLLVGLDDVAWFQIGVGLEPDAAVETAANFGRVILEAA